MWCLCFTEASFAWESGSVFKSFLLVCRCQLISNSSASCRDLAGRNTMFAYPPIDDVPINDLFIETNTVLARDAGVSNECIDLYLHFVCLVEPPCNPRTNLPVLICEESCEIFQQIRTEGFCQRVDELIPIFSMVQDLQLVLYFDCSDSATYFGESITEPDPTICTNLFAPVVRGK